MKKQKIISLFYMGILFSISLFCSLTLALEPQGPLALAMGGSGRGAVQKGAEYHLLNPAALIYSAAFKGSAYYIFEQETKKPYWGFSLLENRKIPIAFTYMRERRSSSQYFNISAAGFLLSGWSLGLGVSRWRIDTEDHHWNIQSGFLIKPQRSAFSIGFTWDYILDLEGAFKGKRKWGLGLAYELYNWLHLRMDTIYDQQKQWTLTGGGKAIISKFLILRLASCWQVEKNTFLFSGGIGLTAKQIAVDYSLSQSKNTKEWIHALSVHSQF